MLNTELFDTLLEARVLIERWKVHDNTVRLHSSPGYRPPAPEAVLTGQTTTSNLDSFTGAGQIARKSSDSAFHTACICREVATERYLLNLHGTFQELPGRDTQPGCSRFLFPQRPATLHRLEPGRKSDHIIRSADGKSAVWAGAIDDLWKLGKPPGTGGPWHNAAVKKNEPSDPYLMTGYNQKQVTIRSTVPTTIRLEVDVDGTGLWIP